MANVFLLDFRASKTENLLSKNGLNFSVQYIQPASSKLSTRSLRLEENACLLSVSPTKRSTTSILVAAKLNAQEFLSESIPQVFTGSTYESITYVDFIPDGEAKNHIRKALDLKEENIYDAAGNLGIAFEWIYHIFEQKTKPRIKQLDPFWDLDKNIRGTIGGAFDKTNKRIMVVGMGLDIRDFMIFKNLAPRTDGILVSDMNEPGGKYLVSFSKQQGEYTLTNEEFDFCLNFVLEAAMKVYG